MATAIEVVDAADGSGRMAPLAVTLVIKTKGQMAIDFLEPFCILTTSVQ